MVALERNPGDGNDLPVTFSSKPDGVELHELWVAVLMGGKRMEEGLCLGVLKDVGKAECCEARRLLPEEGIEQRLRLAGGAGDHVVVAAHLRQSSFGDAHLLAAALGVDLRQCELNAAEEGQLE
ncbi:hypothetical protein D9M70_564550 [compost metagenome]